MTSQPPVSVVMPCFNAQRSVAAALDSILGQSYPNLEVIALDDGSTDSTRAILECYALAHPGLRVLCAPVNHGLIATLNRGVREAGGDLIARMDADDIAVPWRIARQVNALTLRPEIGVVGSATRLVGVDGRRRLRPRPARWLEPAGARFMAVLGTPFAHCTIVARRAVMRAHPYGAGSDSRHTEDYELFTRMLRAGVTFLNLDEPLMTVRVDPEGVSRRHEELQVANFLACARRHLEQTIDMSPPPGALRVLVNRMGDTTSATDLAQGLRCLDRIEDTFVGREPAAAAEIRAVGDLQRVDILTQAMLKGAPGARRAAIGLAVRYRRRILTPPARGYLQAKLASLAPRGVSLGRERAGPAPAIARTPAARHPAGPPA
ncbi:MAG: glycosyltransferase [Solirubrobacteraceae bacterium]|jgi:glycosyltransferase involved in cell wall biosynthesis